MGNQPVRRAFGLYFFRSLAEGQGLALCENIRQQEIVMVTQGIQRFGESKKIAGDQARSLVDELVKGVLAVGTRFAPEDGPGGVVDALAG